MRTLDLFCGAGLGSSGAQRAGVEIVCGIDRWQVATRTFQTNFPRATVKTSLLEEIDPRVLQKEIGHIDLLLSSPECTNHTCAKGSKPRSEESRATAMQTLRFARAFRPRWLALENVVHMRPWSRYEELKAELRNLGYQLEELVLNSAHFGVPQTRRRLFLVGDRDGKPAVPSAAVRRARSVGSILDESGVWRTTPLFHPRRAAGTLQRARRALREVGDQTPFLLVYYGSDGSGGWQPLDRPLRTVTTVDRFALVEPSSGGPQMRMLQVPELSRAMGLSSRFQLACGTRRDKIQLLGNGVCPPVMQQVVKALISRS